MTIFSSLHESWVLFREVIGWPLLFACSPVWLQRKIARLVENNVTFYANEVVAMSMHLPRYLPDSDLLAAGRDLRRILFIDKSDVFFSSLFFQSSMRERVVAQQLPDINKGALILCAHRGNAWWSLPALNAQGKPVHFVSAPLSKPQQLKDYLIWPYQKLRWHAVNTLGGAPLIPMKGASQKIKEILAKQGRVIALIDIPPALAKNCSPVKFFDRIAYMPMQSIQTACDLGTPIYFCDADFDPVMFKQGLDFVSVNSQGGASDVFQQYATWLETKILNQPGSWHFWGHVDSFFEPPST